MPAIRLIFLTILVLLLDPFLTYSFTCNQAFRDESDRLCSKNCDDGGTGVNGGIDLLQGKGKPVKVKGGTRLPTTWMIVMNGGMFY
jgi:hypothetical protein